MHKSDIGMHTNDMDFALCVIFALIEKYALKSIRICTDMQISMHDINISNLCVRMWFDYYAWK